MTLINVASAVIYLKGFPIRDKIQTYALAAIFLILLYNSPSGLVFYWILNNLFSLLKNIVIKYSKHPAQFVHRLISALLIIISLFFLITKPSFDLKKRVALLALSILIAATPFIIKALKKSATIKRLSHVPKRKGTGISFHRLSLFLAGGAGLALLCGLLLPASVISTSPDEFSFIGDVSSPLYYVLNSLTTYIGLFLFWPAVIYVMFGERVKQVLQYLMSTLFIAALLNVYVFGYNYGLLDEFFVLGDSDVLRNYSAYFMITPIVAFIAIIAIFAIARRFRFQRYIATLLFALCFAQVVFSATKINTINNGYKRYAAVKKDDAREIKPIYHLSKTGKNVVILFLDRAISSFFPYIVRQFPELQEQYSGFTYYPNTVCLAAPTAKSTSSMLGGYEYTPEADNKRASEFLVGKHNEALLVLPRLFKDAGFDVFVTDPPYSDYEHTGVYAPFQREKIKCDFVYKDYKKIYLSEHNIEGLNALDIILKKRCVRFCILEATMPILRNTLYNASSYFMESFSNIQGVIENFSHLYYMKDLTDDTATKNTYTFIGSDLAHDIHLLDENYTPSNNIDEKKVNCGYYEYRESANGGNSDLEHYCVNAAAIIQAGKWLNKLRTLGVFDNTRIIIMSDHGSKTCTPAFKGWVDEKTYAQFNPLLLVKDFGDSGTIKTDNTFMTLADVPFIAKKGLTQDVNPFTKKNMSDFIDKKLIKIYPAISTKDFNEVAADTYLKNKKTWILDKKISYSVHDNIFDPNNWQRLDKSDNNTNGGNND